MMNEHNRSRRSKWDTPSSVAPPTNPPPAPTNAQMAALEKSVEGQVSSLEAASAAAARINAMLISKGKLKLPTGITPVPETDDKQKQIVKTTPPKDEKVKNETLVAEVEINEVPIQCRNMLTKGSTQEEISRLTGAAVSTRGRYMSYADRATNNMGERPLYLCVQGPTRESVDRAVDHIKGLIGGGMQNKTAGTGSNRTRTRFSAATSGPAVNTRPPGAPVLSRPPAPGLGATIRGPAAGGASGMAGAVGGGGAGGLRAPGPGPIAPPPAIQLAIQTAQSSGHYLQDKVFIGLEHADPSFNIKEKIQGPGGSFIQHIRTETGANIYLRGRGSGFMEPTSGREAFENLYLYVTHPKADGLQAAKKLCENLVGTIQAEYMSHQSQVFQRSAPAMAAAHMIAPSSRPAQPMAVQQQATLQPAQQPPRALGLPPSSLAAIPGVNTSLSQTLAAQQQAQAILAQRTAVSSAVSVQQGVAYPSLQPQAGVPAGQLAGPRGVQPGVAPQPVPAPAPVPPPQRILQQQVITPASQPQLYGQPVQVAVSQPGQHTFAQAQAQAQAAVQAAQAQVQAHAQMVQAQGGQIQVPVQPPQATVGGLPVGTPQPVIPQPLGAPPSQPSTLQQQQAVSHQQHQPVKRRFREDLPPEQPEHHPPQMTNLGVSPPGHSPLGIAGGIRGSAGGGGQGLLMRLPGQPPEDARLMPPPPNPQAMRDAGRKRLSSGLDIHGGRLSPEEEARIKRGRLVSYEASGDSDEDEDRNRFDRGGRFRGYMDPPLRGLPPPSSLSTSTATSLSSSHHKAERRELGAGSSPFWMARN